MIILLVLLIISIIECKEYYFQNVHTLYYLKNCRKTETVCTYHEREFNFESKWSLEQKNDTFLIISKRDGRCLDVSDYDWKIYLNKCNNMSSQDWVLIKTDSFVFKIFNVEERCVLSSDLDGNVFATFFTVNSEIPDNKWFIFQ